ncbi:sulfite exporter TauE/SafE family protein [Luteococcus sp. OSA5]|uniref:sulfite exporter TauE/SafE family protein n=1 Tax=Luteococcus sp. OSA5 TaxID=3401630 RepID=UPI003B43B02F
MLVAPHVMLGLVLAAFVAGWIDAVVGGGGLVQLPALLIGLPDDTPVATIAGTNKLPAASGTLMATLTYLRSVRVDWGSALPLMATAWLGSTVGANLAQHVPRRWFTPIVLVVILVVGAYTLRRPQLGLQQHLRHQGPAHWWRLLGLGAGVGLYDGILGPGTGTFFVIGLVAVLGYGFLEASALTKLANLTTNVAAITVFTLSGHILWPVALCMAVANLTGGLLGARMAVRHGNGFVRRVFLLVVGVLALKLAWDTVVLFVP